MQWLSYSKLGANAKAAIDRAVNDHEVIVIRRTKGGDAVLLSREDYAALVETATRFCSPEQLKQRLDEIQNP